MGVLRLYLSVVFIEENFHVNLEEWAGVTDYERRATLAVVFTDIIDSTTLAREVGDGKMFDMLVKHFDAAREVSLYCDGFEIKLIGDAYMVAFKTADAALLFATQFQQHTGDPRIGIRAGIHVGQVRIKDNDIYGLMVNYASRLQHALPLEGIYLSDFAKREIESERGTAQTDFRFSRLPANLPSFGEQEVIWQVMTPEIREARRARRRAKQVEEARKNPKPTTTPQVKLPDPPRPTLSLGIRPRRLVSADEPETPIDLPRRLLNRDDPILDAMLRGVTHPPDKKN